MLKSLSCTSEVQRSNYWWCVFLMLVRILSSIQTLIQTWQKMTHSKSNKLLELKLFCDQTEAVCLVVQQRALQYSVCVHVCACACTLSPKRRYSFCRISRSLQNRALVMVMWQTAWQTTDTAELLPYSWDRLILMFRLWPARQSRDNQYLRTHLHLGMVNICNLWLIMSYQV